MNNLKLTKLTSNELNHIKGGDVPVGDDGGVLPISKVCSCSCNCGSGDTTRIQASATVSSAGLSGASAFGK